MTAQKLSKLTHKLVFIVFRVPANVYSAFQKSYKLAGNSQI